MTQAELKTDLVAEYAAWLTGFLPNDYYERYREYRWDIGLRRAHQRAAFEAGWLQPTWSPEHGGRSLGLAEAMEIRLEAAMRSAPKLPNVAGPGVAAPGIRQFGTAAQIDRLLVPLLRGDEWWALGMSEPEAGSDFASLRTRAVRDGDSVPGQGQKDLDDASPPVTVVHAVCPYRSGRTQTSRNLLSHPRSRIPRGHHRTHSDGIDLR